jgi:lipoprotein-anchoring transpeptidase ErfK/SrfK
MRRNTFQIAFVLVVLEVAAALLAGPASAQQMSVAPGQPMPPMVVAAQPPQMQANLGGGFIEFLFGDHHAPQPHYATSPQYAVQPQYAPPPPQFYPPQGVQQPMYANTAPTVDPMQEQQQPGYRMDPRFLRQEVEYHGTEEPGTIVIDTPNHFLYLVEPGGKAMRYGIGVGRPGFTWSGVHAISATKEWPDWVPPKEMLERQPYLPHFMSGGPNNPLGARALYIGSTLYRIHGSNEPWTIGHNVSSGCIRLRNADVIDLYSRVKVGTKVVVL